jgi:hypothetical protein
MELYRHTQPGYVIRVAMLLGSATVAAIFFGMRGAPFNAQLVAGVTLVALLLSIVLFYSLTVTVTEDQVRLSFGPGVIRRSWALESIVSCRIVRNPWYYGWGIHHAAGGWLYNVSGFSAVELTLRDGSRCRIGTDAPEELERAIARSKQQSQ